MKLAFQQIYTEKTEKKKKTEKIARALVPLHVIPTDLGYKLINSYPYSAKIKAFHSIKSSAELF